MAGETVYTVELDAWEPASQGIIRLRYATRGFASAPSDTPPHAFFDERLEQPAVLSRSLFSAGATSGRSKVGYGDLILANGDGALDALLTYGFDGRSVTIRKGLRGAAYPSGYAIQAELTAEQVEATDRAIIVKIRDRQLELEVALQPTKYAGDNVPPDGLEGGPDDLLGKPKPRCFGQVFNVPAVLVNAAKLIYQVNDGPVASIPAVYDRGIELLTGRLWRLQTSPFGTGDLDLINAVAWGASTYVAVGTAGALATSPDGKTWTSRTSGFGADEIEDVAFGEGLFVAVGGAGKIFTSPTGETWTSRTSNLGSETILAVLYVAPLGIFVAAGTTGALATSPDGITWTSRTSNLAAGAITGLAFGGTMIVAVTTGAEIASSLDGITWVVRTSTITANGFVSVAYGTGIFVATSSTSTGLSATSLDGVTWTLRPGTPFVGGYGQVFYGTQFVVTGGQANEFATSEDGLSWTPLAGLFGTSFILNGVYNPDDDAYVLVGQNGKIALGSPATYADAVELEADTLAPAAGEFTAWLNGGYFRLGAPPAGLVTADVTEGALVGDRTAGQIFARLLTHPLGTPFVEFSSADVALLDGEPQLISQPENFDHAAWTKETGAALTAGQDDPLGGTAAYLLTDSSATVGRIYSAVSFTGDGTKTISCFIRQGTLAAIEIGIFDNNIPVWRHNVLVVWTSGVPVLTTNLGSGTLFPVEAWGGGWYRIALAVNNVVAASPENLLFIGSSTGTGTIYIFGANAWDAPQPYSYQGPSQPGRSCDAPLGLWSGVEEMTVAQAVDRVAQSVGAWWGVDRSGVFRIQQFTAPSGTPTFAFTADDIRADSLQRLPATDPGRGLPVWRTVVRYARNYSEQTTDLAAGVDDDRRAFLARDYREATAEDAAVQLAHPLAPQAVIETLLASVADAQAEATRLQALRGSVHDRFSVVVALDDDTAALDLGHVGTLTHPRYGLTGGPSVRVLKVEPDVERRTLTLDLWK